MYPGGATTADAGYVSGERRRANHCCWLAGQTPRFNAPACRCCSPVAHKLVCKRTPRSLPTAVRLYCLNQDPAPRARFTIAVLGEDGSVQLEHDSGVRLFDSWACLGWFASREQLSQRGLLAGNSLRLRVTITLV